MKKLAAIAIAIITVEFVRNTSPEVVMAFTENKEIALAALIALASKPFISRYCL